VKFKIVDRTTQDPLKNCELNICKFVYFKLKPATQSPYLDKDADWYITSVVTDENGVFMLDLSLIKETHIVIAPEKLYDTMRFSRVSDMAGTKSVDHIRVTYFSEGLTKRVYDLKKGTVKVIADSGETVEEPFTEILLTATKNENELYGEAEVVMLQFQQALKDSDWDRALGLCSENVKSKVDNYGSAEAFFRDIVPVDEVASLSQIQTSGGKYDRDGRRLEFFCFLRIPTTAPIETVDWAWAVGKSDSGWVIDFETISLKQHIEKERIRRMQEKQRALERRENLKNSLGIRLVALSEEFVVGKPMLFRVEMTNVSKSQIEYMGTSSVMVNDPMIIKGPDGNLISYVDTSYQTWALDVVIKPGQTVILAENYDVTSQYSIVKPGRYAFQSNALQEYGIALSNIVEIDVKPGEPFSEDIIFEKLLSVLPKGWRLTRTRARNISDLDRARGICLSLVGKRDSKGTPRGTIAIFMWINPQKSDLDAIEFDGESWGRSEWGPVYVKSFDADVLWLDYKEQIVKALNIEKRKPD
jgi:hypothetical protein